jgi:hypothetical protein
MKYQTNPELGQYLNHWGCYIISILEKVEKANPGFKFSNSDIDKVYITAMRHGYVSLEVNRNGNPFDGCTVQNYTPDQKWDGHGTVGIFNTACDMFGLKNRCISSRHESKNYIPISGEEEILELKRDKYKGSHFVDGNGKANVHLLDEIEFDPIEGGSQCAKLGWIDSKRILKIEVNK